MLAMQVAGISGRRHGNFGGSRGFEGYDLNNGWCGAFGQAKSRRNPITAMIWKARNTLSQFDDEADPDTRGMRKLNDADAANLDQPGAAPGRSCPKLLLRHEKFDAVVGNEGCPTGDQSQRDIRFSGAARAQQQNADIGRRTEGLPRTAEPDAAGMNIDAGGFHSGIRDNGS